MFFFVWFGWFLFLVLFVCLLCCVSLLSLFFTPLFFEVSFFVLMLHVFCVSVCFYLFAVRLLS